MAGHKCDESKLKHLDNPIRRILLPSTKILNDIKPKNNEVWADIGCGTGHFTIPLAGLCKKVYALDISITMLDMLRKNLNSKGVDNIELFQSQESLLPLDTNNIDGVLMAFVAHEVDKPHNFFSEVTRILKPGGRVNIVEFAKVLSFGGPPLSHRLAPEQMDTWASEVGLSKGKSWKWSRSIVGWEYLKAQ